MTRPWDEKGKEVKAILKLIPYCRTVSEVAAKHNTKWKTGRSPDAIRAKLVRDGISSASGLLGSKIKQRKADIPVAKQISEIVAMLSHKSMDIMELSDALDLSPSRTKAYLRMARDQGHTVEVEAGRVSVKDEAPAPDRWAVHRLRIEPVADELRFLVISDTHYGSAHHRPECVEDAVSIAYEDFGIRTVLHAGDMYDGLTVYRGQETELLDHSFDTQVDRAVKELPKRKGLTYHVIGGNHDENFLKHSRADGIRKLGEMRPDVKVHGYYGALVDLAPPGKSGLRVELHHGGNMSYARSYTLQKKVEAIPGGMKPQIFLCGHLHHCVQLPSYRGVAAFLLPCFQDQTLLFKRLRAVPEIGAIIFKVGITRSGSVKTMAVQYITYFHSQRGPVRCKDGDDEIRMARSLGNPGYLD